jgi:two-component system LytT family response regulator
MPFSLQRQSSHRAMIGGQSQPIIENHNQELHFCKCSFENMLAHQTSAQRLSYVNKMLVKLKGRLIIVQTLDIDWIEAWGDYVRLHCKEKTHIVRQKVNQIEARLDQKQFLRIGRSAIVNVDRIKELEPLHHGDYIVSLYDNTLLNLSRNYRDRLIALFDTHL